MHEGASRVFYNSEILSRNRVQNTDECFFTAPANKSIVHGAIENPDDHPKWRITSPNPELQNNKSAIYKEIESDNSSDFASCNPSAQFLSTPEHSS